MARSIEGQADANVRPEVRPNKPLCATAPRPKPQVSDAVRENPNRSSAILESRAKWLNATVIHYCFFTSGKYAVPQVQADAIRDAFAQWKAVGIGLNFQEVQQLDEAEVRIGYSLAEGASQSAVGREVLTIPLDEPTTQYGWDLTTRYGKGTALHELGHVIGMEHEHQSPFAGIKWHEEAVYESLAQPPNSWSRATTYRNILEKLTSQNVEGSSWDADSIMEYEFEAGLIDEPDKYDTGGLVPPGTLSEADKAWALKWYPGVTTSNLESLEPFKSVAVNLDAGQQVDFMFHPSSSRKYTIATNGALDTLLGLFEDVAGVPRYLSADDDSGEDRNASITYKLFQGRTYRIRLRLFYPGQTGRTSIMVS